LVLDRATAVAHRDVRSDGAIGNPAFDEGEVGEDVVRRRRQRDVDEVAVRVLIADVAEAARVESEVVRRPACERAGGELAGAVAARAAREEVGERGRGDVPGDPARTYHQWRVRRRGAAELVARQVYARGDRRGHDGRRRRTEDRDGRSSRRQ
jgi:hypothetical protein